MEQTGVKSKAWNDEHHGEHVRFTAALSKVRRSSVKFVVGISRLLPGWQRRRPGTLLRRLLRKLTLANKPGAFDPDAGVPAFCHHA